MNKQEQLRYDYIGVGICIAVASVLRNSAGSSPTVNEALGGAGIDMKELDRLKPLLDLDDYEYISKHLREESKNDRWKLRG